MSVTRLNSDYRRKSVECRYCGQSDWGKNSCNRCGGEIPDKALCHPAFKRNYLWGSVVISPEQIVRMGTW